MSMDELREGIESSPLYCTLPTKLLLFPIQFIFQAGAYPDHGSLSPKGRKNLALLTVTVSK